jgi:two-component system, OmpR family, response regulator ChvI
MVYQEDEISFVRAQDCCVCFVDIVDSTRVTSSINSPEKVRKYYEIFLNTMAAISRNFGAKIIKNVGDCLILCYPRTSDTSNKSAFNDVLECCITMIEARNTINQKLHEEGLPSLSYRISADYGRVEVARSATSQSDDLFGPTMNMCSKINSKAPTNGVAIGDGLYKVIETFSSLSSLEENCYHFEELVTLEHEFNKYPLYSLQNFDLLIQPFIDSIKTGLLLRGIVSNCTILNPMPVLANTSMTSESFMKSIIH